MISYSRTNTDVMKKLKGILLLFQLWVLQWDLLKVLFHGELNKCKTWTRKADISDNEGLNFNNFLCLRHKAHYLYLCIFLGK
jgi:hypothetical protein